MSALLSSTSAMSSLLCEGVTLVAALTVCKTGSPSARGFTGHQHFANRTGAGLTSELVECLGVATTCCRDQIGNRREEPPLCIEPCVGAEILAMVQKCDVVAACTLRRGRVVALGHVVDGRLHVDQRGKAG